MIEFKYNDNAAHRIDNPVQVAFLIFLVFLILISLSFGVGYLVTKL